MAGAHPFDRAIALEPLAPVAAGGALRFRGATSPDYANMVGPYGGITVAQVLQAVILHPDRLGEPVAFTGNFAAAMADGDFIVEAQPVRTNRSTQHWVLSVNQRGADGNDAVVFTATAVTAVRRQTWGVTETPMPPAPNAEEVPRVQVPQRPVWFSRYDMRWLTGAIPRQWDGAERADSLTRLWMRDDPPRPMDFPSLAAFCDAFYPRAWLRRARPTPASTISLTVYFHADGAALAAAGDNFVLAQARGRHFFNGYFDQSGQVWSASGELLATTHQVVYYRE